jgi:membrane protein
LKTDRVVRTGRSVVARGEGVARSAQDWADRQEDHSVIGVGLGWVRRYRAADGQLFSLLLAAYLFVTVVPASLAIVTYSGRDAQASAGRLIERLDLHGATADLVRNVLVGAGGHQFTATLVAVASVLTFGMGIGRALQLIYGRVWDVPVRGSAIVDRIKYLVWLLVFMAGFSLFELQSVLLSRSAGDWLNWVLAPVWIAATIAFLTWTPGYLLHGRVSRRDVLPGAVLATAGLVGLRIASSLVFTNWLNWYGKYYGGIGIVMAIFFWLALSTTVIVVCAGLSPAYAVRRAERRGGRNAEGGG